MTTYLYPSPLTYNKGPVDLIIPHPTCQPPFGRSKRETERGKKSATLGTLNMYIVCPGQSLATNATLTVQMSATTAYYNSQLPSNSGKQDENVSVCPDKWRSPIVVQSLLKRSTHSPCTEDQSYVDWLLSVTVDLWYPYVHDRAV